MYIRRIYLPPCEEEDIYRGNIKSFFHNHKVRDQILFFKIWTPKKNYKKNVRLALTKQNTYKVDENMGFWEVGTTPNDHLPLHHCPNVK